MKLNYNVDMVVSRYNENVDWIDNFKDILNLKVLIYHHGNPDNSYNIPKNVGNEATVYFKYIIDHYDNLPEYIYLVHAEYKSWHHKGNLYERLDDAIKENKLFSNINNKIWKFEDITKHAWYSKIMVLWKDYIEKYIPYEKLLDTNFIKDHKTSAQFYVNKSRILRYPKIFYENLYNWLLTTKINTYESSRYMEQLWHIFWEDYDKILK